VIDQFDIVCAQEVFGFLNSRKHRLIYSSLKKGFYYHAEAPNPSFFSSYLVDGGLLTLSKFPIIYEEYRAFGYGVLSDTLSQKGILYTKIQINDAYLHLFNTHLQASYVGEESKVRATVVTRIDQLQVLRKFVDEMLDLH
jgi:sphingomyelin phosphodiesterase